MTEATQGRPGEPGEDAHGGHGGAGGHGEEPGGPGGTGGAGGHGGKPGRRDRLVVVVAGLGVVALLVVAGLAILFHSQSSAGIAQNKAALQGYHRAEQQDRSNLKRIEADERRLCHAARITKFQPIIEVLCNQEGQPFPSPTPKATGGTSASSVNATPEPTESSAPTPEPTANPTPLPTPTPTPFCIGPICL